MRTQRQEILDYINDHGSITRAQSAHLYIFELSSRIGELATKGDDDGVKWKFEHTWVKGKRPGGRPWTVVRYSDPQRLEPQKEMRL